MKNHSLPLIQKILNPYNIYVTLLNEFTINQHYHHGLILTNKNQINKNCTVDPCGGVQLKEQLHYSHHQL